MAGITTSSRRGRGVTTQDVPSVLHDLIVQFNQLVDDVEGIRAAAGGNGVLQIGTLLISATAEDFKTTTTLYWRRNGIQFTKAATDNLSFTANDTINTGAATGMFWGVWLVQIDDAGTITTKSPAEDQVYTTEALAIAALPAVDAGNTAIGYITVQTEADVDWVANTDDLTPTGDCTDANFYDATPVTLTDEAADLLAAKIGDSLGVAILLST
jgi:hypothetical protein